MNATRLASVRPLVRYVEEGQAVIDTHIALHPPLPDAQPVDAADVLRDPAAVLGRLCAALGIGFDPAMLSWAPGPRDTDGVWAPHWYAAVQASTGFAPYVPAPAEVPERLRPLVAAAQPYYDELAAHRLTG